MICSHSHLYCFQGISPATSLATMLLVGFFVPVAIVVTGQMEENFHQGG